MHLESEYRPIEFPVSHRMQNLDQSVAFCATTLFTFGWRPVHNFHLMFTFPTKVEDIPYIVGIFLQKRNSFFTFICARIRLRMKTSFV